MNINDKNELIIFLFKNCLFNVTMDSIDLESVMCKSSSSWTVLMELIADLVKDDVKSV